MPVTRIALGIGRTEMGRLLVNEVVIGLKTKDKFNGSALRAHERDRRAADDLTAAQPGVVHG